MATISIRRCLALLSSMLAFPITGWAQDDPWAALVVQADSLGPETPPVLPTRRLACGPGVQRPDSIRVSGRDPEFLFATTSRRTRGYFQYLTVPEAGTGTFAVRELYCDDQGRPYTFVLERDHRYFFAIFSLREIFTYS